MTQSLKTHCSYVALAAALLSAPILQAQSRRFEPISVGRKQALVIGNAVYPSAPLKNPVNDALAMQSALKKLGFDVTMVQNVDLPHMEAAIDHFAQSLTSQSFAFVYFSGHGVQVNFSNYLLPIDFNATSEADVKYKAYPATRLQEKLEESRARLRVLVLDACRNNPFRYSRDATSGLAAMSVNAEGTLIAFATGDHNTADDNASESNGLYTKQLIRALQTPGLNLRDVFQVAKEDTYAASSRKQNPSIYDNVIGSYYLTGVPAMPVPPAPARIPQNAPSTIATADPAHQVVLGSDSSTVWISTDNKNDVYGFLRFDSYGAVTWFRTTRRCTTSMEATEQYNSDRIVSKSAWFGRYSISRDSIKFTLNFRTGGVIDYNGVVRGKSIQFKIYNHQYKQSIEQRYEALP
jgi:hypothetical protein